MLLFGAIGDAYGAGFEFANRKIIDTENDLTHYRPHPKFAAIDKKYTDDTQMAIGLSELIISQKDWTAAHIADKFVAAFKRDKREGYAKRFYQFLIDINNGTEFLEKIMPNSERNGAAMRDYPLGIFKTEQEVIEKNKIQTFVTHQTETALIASEAIALASHFFIYNKGNQSQLLAYLNDFQNRKWSANWQGEVSMNAI
jgi:ADP-ribosyl-[dinitrogen reductase] hydrolase